MKILHLIGTEEGHDYAALLFEEAYSGQHVDKLIKKIQNGEKLTAVQDEEQVEFNIRIIDTPDIVISREFRDFIKNELLDYDDGKHSNFYLQTDIIK